MRRASAGYGLVKLLVAVLVLSVAMAAVVVVFSAQDRAYLRADTQATMEANLRLGMNMVTESLRNAKYGVPTANLSTQKFLPATAGSQEWLRRGGLSAWCLPKSVLLQYLVESRPVHFLHLSIAIIKFVLLEQLVEFRTVFSHLISIIMPT